MWVAKAESSGPQPEQGPQPLIDYLPKSKQGAILFTTRDRKIAVKLAQQNVVDVPAMGEDAATRLLEKCLVNPDLINSRQDTNNLLSQLTYLPLAIVQAAAYINENGIAIADYLSLLADQEEDVIELLSEEFEDDGRYRDFKNPVATTWLISFEQIRQRDPLAADYLSFMACFEPKDIPQSLLPPGASRKREIDAIGTLTAYSFITRRPADMALDLHRLVHLATRNWLRMEEQLAQSTEKAIVRLEEVFPDDDHKNRSLWRTYLPHVRYMLDSNHVSKDWKSRMDLLWRYGSCLYEDGRWNEAEIPITQVLEMQKRLLGEEHPSTLTSMTYLASTLWNQGRWDEAERLFVQVIETRKTVLGPEHPETLVSMKTLGSKFWNQKRWTDAENLFVQILNIRKRVYGGNDPDTLISMADLASTLHCEGRFKDAEELEMQVMKTSADVLGEEHYITLHSMCNLGVAFHHQSRHDDSEALFTKVMDMRRKVLGLEHPDTLRSMARLASTYSDRGRWKDAENLEVQVMNGFEKVLGPEHPHTLISMANLASTYRNQGRWEEAEELEVQVMGTRKTKLGADHPDTLISMNNLAFIWKGWGRDMEAMSLMAECAQRQQRAFGVNNPHSISSSMVLAEWKTEEASAGSLTQPPQP